MFGRNLLLLVILCQISIGVFPDVNLAPAVVRLGARGPKSQVFLKCAVSEADPPSNDGATGTLQAEALS